MPEETSAEKDCQSTDKVARMLGSTFFLITISMVACLIIALSIPPSWLNAEDGVPSQYRWQITKVSRYLNSKEDADVLILGSSLMLFPAVRCDDAFAQRPECRAKWYYYKHIPDYTRSEYFQSNFNRLSGLNLQFKNLAVLSSIASDHETILDAVLRQGKHPRLIICAIAPRDMMDNKVPLWRETPARLLLSEYYSPGFRLPSSLTISDLNDAWTTDQHQLQKVVAKLKRNWVEVATNLTGHPDVLQDSETVIQGEQANLNLEKDLAGYRHTYNPPNYKTLALQAEHLNAMLANAQQHGVKFVLVNMPLTQQNFALLDPKAHQAYLDAIRTAANRYDALFVDIAAHGDEFGVSDFEDSVHLNTQGGTKMYKELISAVLADKHLLAYVQR